MSPELFEGRQSYQRETEAKQWASYCSTLLRSVESSPLLFQLGDYKP
jgi:hypothetical protein